MNNDFRIKFSKDDKIKECTESFSYDEEMDSIVSIFDDVCEALSETEKVHFVVEGFGQANWPVDVGADLSVVLEQLPSLCECLSSGTGTVDVDFYEQGLERNLKFECINDDVTITCESRTNWQPKPSKAKMKRSELTKMIRKFRNGFIDAAKEICPGTVSHRWFREWIDQVNRL